MFWIWQQIENIFLENERKPRSTVEGNLAVFQITLPLDNFES